MENIRTRFAPSPTGYMHIGNLRTAIYAYLMAKVHHGKFILRIEDTDQNRYVPEALEVIYKTLAAAGIIYDEGPDVGGAYGPYIQSQRKELYKRYAQELVERDGAYYCFCDKARLDTLRQKCESEGIPYRYDGHCRKLSAVTVHELLQKNELFVVRQKVPAAGQTVFNDCVYGTVTVANAELDEGILMKSDGLPTYNFANVVDDHLMQITHVIRGSEYVSSTPKYNLLYDAFGWRIPEYVHLPPILKSHGKKLSKREGDASFDDFVKKGYLPEAIVNYIILLGWSPGNDEEIFSLHELATKFSISGLSKSPAIFDEQKLRWMNGEYIRKKTPGEFHCLALPYYESLHGRNIPLEEISTMVQPRITLLSEISEQIAFCTELPDYSIELFSNKKSKSDPQIASHVLTLFKNRISTIQAWNHQDIYASMVAIAQELHLKNSQVFWPIRIAISGREITPGGAPEIAEILGRELSIERIEIALNKLNG
ncbi:MAG: glutamate--tRNA ligase, partial [Chitinivibrionales bacterium]|nr:glutamate--tRNA ligase [Chitinivibrionales bacterium]